MADIKKLKKLTTHNSWWINDAVKRKQKRNMKQYKSIQEFMNAPVPFWAKVKIRTQIKVMNIKHNILLMVRSFMDRILHTSSN